MTAQHCTLTGSTAHEQLEMLRDALSWVDAAGRTPNFTKRIDAGGERSRDCSSRQAGRGRHLRRADGASVVHGGSFRRRDLCRSRCRRSATLCWSRQMRVRCSDSLGYVPQDTDSVVTSSPEESRICRISRTVAVRSKTPRLVRTETNSRTPSLDSFLFQLIINTYPSEAR